MKNKSSIILISLLSLFFLSFLALFLVIGFYSDVNRMHPEKIDYEITDIIELKVGEKIKYSDLNHHFKDYEPEYSADYLHNYHDYTLTGSKGTELDRYLGKNFTLDTEGYLTPNKVGLYKFEYLLTKVQNEPYGGQVQNFIFSNLFYVTDDYSNYTPIYSASDFYPKNNLNDNYILMNNITINTVEFNDSEWRHSSGTFINPYGYTITIEKGPDTDETGALFYTNYGILDGLKINFVSDRQNSYTQGFFGIAKQNTGLIKDCTISGTVYSTTMENDFNVTPTTPRSNLSGCAFVLPRDGFVLNNTASDLKIYSNNHISLYNYLYKEENNFPNPLAKYQRVENNKLEVDFYYVNDNLGLKNRIPYFEEENNTNNTYYCPTSKSYPNVNEVAKISLRISGWDHTAKEKTYYQAVNSPLSVPQSMIYSAIERTDNEPELAVKYWLVNNVKHESLDGLIVTENLTLQPVVKYTGSQFNADNRKYYNDNEEKITLALEDNELYLQQDFFYNFFANPRNVIPKQITIGKKCLFYSAFSTTTCNTTLFDDKSTALLQDYLLNGGSIKIEAGHPSFIILNDKMICAENGTRLLHYFYEEDEQKIRLHNQITTVNNYAFQKNEAVTEINFANASSIYENCIDNLPNIQKIIFGKSFQLLSTNNYPLTFPEFMGDLTTLQEVEISNENSVCEVIDEFIVSVNDEQDQTKTLHFALPSLTGEITLPANINKLDYACFCKSDITAIKFNETYTEKFYFNKTAFINLEKLERIEFGNFTTLSSTSTSIEAKLPNLTTITFKENVENCSLLFDINDFEYANLQKVVLPKTLSNFTPIICNEYEISKENPYYFTQDGVLYRDPYLKVLISFPSQKEIDEYTILEGTNQIGSYAFYNSKVKNVTINSELSYIAARAFENSAVQKILLNENDNSEISKSKSLTIANYAFASCKDLCELNLGMRTISLLEGSFFGCSSLTSFPFLNVKSIGSHAFTDSGITEVVIGSITSDIYNSAFENSAVKKVTFATDCTITNIPTSLFENCTNLTEVNLGNITTLSEHAFDNCMSLSTIDIPNLTILGRNAFYNCSALKTINMPLVTNIPDSAFYGCTSLYEVTFANEISVGNLAFYGCTSLAKINSKINSVGTQAFINCNELTELHIKNATSLNTTDLPNNHTTLKLYLNVNEEFVFSGVIPENYIIYVPNDMVEKFLYEWIVSKEQLIAYDFLNNEE